MVSFANRVEVPAHVLVRFLENESVLLNLETERYYGLDDTGTRMWQVVTAAASIDEEGQLRGNLSELLGRLVEHGLLQVHSADVGTASAV